jgi:hypothetical protein
MTPPDSPLGDGDEPTNGATIAERAAEGEHEQDIGPEPVRSDGQLTLNLGTVAKGKRVQEATLALSAQEVAIDGLLKPDDDYTFLVRGRVQHYVTVPIRDKDGNTMAFKQRQPVRVMHVRRADDAETVHELFSDLIERDAEAAGVLLDELRVGLSEALRQPAAA